MKKLIFHTIGIATTLSCVAFTVYAFLWMSVTGGKAFYWEPILGVRYVELMLFSFTLIYVGYLVKVVWFNNLKKLVWEKQKKEFYKCEKY